MDPDELETMKTGVSLRLAYNQLCAIPGLAATLEAIRAYAQMDVPAFMAMSLLSLIDASDDPWPDTQVEAHAQRAIQLLFSCLDRREISLLDTALHLARP
jgi:hypothetical protein